MASDAEQGQLQPAPESFLSKDLVEDISREGINPGRRSLLQGAFAAAAAKAFCSSERRPGLKPSLEMSSTRSLDKKDSGAGWS